MCRALGIRVDSFPVSCALMIWAFRWPAWFVAGVCFVRGLWPEFVRGLWPDSIGTSFAGDDDDDDGTARVN